MRPDWFNEITSGYIKAKTVKRTNKTNNTVFRNESFKCFE